MQTNIRRRRTQRLISVSTVCKKCNHFSLGISKSHSRTYLNLKFDSSSIQCGWVNSFYNELNRIIKIRTGAWTQHFIQYCICTHRTLRSACQMLRPIRVFTVRLNMLRIFGYLQTAREDSERIVLMHRLIWDFAGCTYNILEIAIYMDHARWKRIFLVRL